MEGLALASYRTRCHLCRKVARVRMESGMQHNQVMLFSCAIVPDIVSTARSNYEVQVTLTTAMPSCIRVHQMYTFATHVNERPPKHNLRLKEDPRVSAREW